jgi:MFS superfamily sulfate permease-like transporter
MTAVIVRSAANVNAGAQTRLSSILHSLWILVFVVALTSILRTIPLVVLSSALIVTGIKLLDLQGWIRMAKAHEITLKVNFILGVLSILAILATSLLVGLVISLVLTLIVQSVLRHKYSVQHSPGLH